MRKGAHVKKPKPHKEVPASWWSMALPQGSCPYPKSSENPHTQSLAAPGFLDSNLLSVQKNNQSAVLFMVVLLRAILQS